MMVSVRHCGLPEVDPNPPGFCIVDSGQVHIKEFLSKFNLLHFGDFVKMAIRYLAIWKVSYRLDQRQTPGARRKNPFGAGFFYAQIIVGPGRFGMIALHICENCDTIPLKTMGSRLLWRTG